MRRQLLHYKLETKLKTHLDEEVADVGHEVGEAEEAVSLCVGAPLLPRVGGEDVVDGPDDLVHALDVALPGVELGVDEEDPLDDLPVRLVAVLQRRVVLGRLPLGQRQLVHPDADALDRLRLQPSLLHPHVQPVARVLGDLRVGRRRRLAEEGDVGAQAAHVLVDLQQDLMFKL